ncbi:MAG: hypothetical protein ABIE74_01320 [Pseudomonadota bacterium]
MLLSIVFRGEGVESLKKDATLREFTENLRKFKIKECSKIHDLTIIHSEMHLLFRLRNNDVEGNIEKIKKILIALHSDKSVHFRPKNHHPLLPYRHLPPSKRGKGKDELETHHKVLNTEELAFCTCRYYHWLPVIRGYVDAPKDWELSGYSFHILGKRNGIIEGVLDPLSSIDLAEVIYESSFIPDGKYHL